MTEQELQAIEARLLPSVEDDGNTYCVNCGPLVEVDEDGCCVCCGCDSYGKWASPAACAPTDIAALLAEVRRLQEEHKRLEKREQFATTMYMCELQANRGGY